MLKVYFNIALRSLLKNKFFSFLNISGLAVGIGCVLMIYLYVNHELSYDNHIPNADRIYRVNTKGKFGGSDIHLCIVNASMGPIIINDFPEIESYTRFRENGSQIIKYGENSIKEDHAIFADSNYFEFWGAKMLEGNPKTALKDPNSLVLSAQLAKKIFGDKEAMGEYVKLAGKYEYKVTGIMEAMPDNTHFKFEALMSMASLEEAKELPWLNINFHTYFRLVPGASAAGLEAKFPAMIEKYIGPELQSIMGVSLADFKKSGNDIGYYLQPLKDLHLRTTAEGGFDRQGDIKYIYIFSAIGLFILTLACINFMNLATARSANRAKEVGIKKVMGALRHHLVSQFISESTLIALISLIGGIGLVYISFPFFNEIAGLHLSPEALYQADVIFFMVLLVIFIGIAAGSYPAFFLSRFQPVKVLKGKLSGGAKSSALRSVLVTFQFGISIFLIIGTLVVFNQLQYLQNKKLGFDKDQIIILENTYMLRNSIEAFRDEVLQSTAFKDATISSYTPSPATSNWVTAFWEGKTVNKENTSTMSFYQIDEHYLSTYGMELTTGRNFDPSMSTDTAAVIINEAAVNRFGFKDDPVGKYISHFNNLNGNAQSISTLKVIGVVKNFHFKDLKSAILPLVMAYEPSDGRISFRINTDDYNAVTGLLKEKWNEFAPGQPFEYKFLDQTLQSQYENEQKVSELFEIFTGLTIFVACLGLFGLASFTTEQRAKEIGIRKVLGASVSGIVVLISKDFMKLVLISFILAAPLAYVFMSSWLEDFEYRVSISIWIFVGAGTAAFLIAWLTLSYQSIKAAIVNPTNSLRSE